MAIIKFLAAIVALTLSGCSIGPGGWFIKPGIPKCIYGKVGSGNVNFPTPAGAVTLSGKDIEYKSIGEECKGVDYKFHSDDTASEPTEPPEE